MDRYIDERFGLNRLSYSNAHELHQNYSCENIETLFTNACSVMQYLYVSGIIYLVDMYAASPP